MNSLPKVARRAAVTVASWALVGTPLDVAAQPAPAAPPPAAPTVSTVEMRVENLTAGDVIVGQMVTERPVIVVASPDPVPRASIWPWRETTSFNAVRPAFPRKEFMGASIDEMTVGAALIYCQDAALDLSSPPLPQRLTALSNDPFKCSMAVIHQVGLDYAHRADSRQKQSDWAAAIAVASTAALVIGDGKMVTHTQDLWAVGALLPILQDDIRAVTPRAMLYRSASNAIFLVSNKYSDLDQALGKFAGAWLPNSNELGQVCNLLEDWSREVKTVKAELPGELVLEDLRSRLEFCRNQEKALNQYLSPRRRWLRYAGSAWAVDKARLGALAGRNAGQLVRHVAGIDAVMKADPFMAVRTAAAAPFQRAADIIGGTVKGRNDPLDGRQYELALVSGLAPGDIPGMVGTKAKPADSVLSAIAILAAPKDANRESVAEAASAMRSGLSGTAAGDGIPAVPRTPSLEWVSGYLDHNSDLLNIARDLAIEVQRIDHQLDLNLDPRKAVIDPKAVAAAAGAKKAAEAAAAAETAGEAPKTEAPAQEEPKPEEPAAD